MLTPKKIAIPAAVGFVISFVISLIFTHSLFWSLIRGLIFGVVFALLFLLVDFLFSTFLEQASDVEVSSAKKPSSLGNKVDIVISDEDLTDDGENLRFSVNNNKKILDDQTLKESDAKADVLLDDAGAAMQNAPDSEKESFLQSAKETAATAATVAAAKQDENKPSFVASSIAEVTSPGASSSASASSDGGAVDGIDSLPDLSGFDALTGDVEDSSDVIDDTEFASRGVSSPASRGSTFSDGTKAADHDTETLAKAISTILKRDE